MPETTPTAEHAAAYARAHAMRADAFCGFWLALFSAALPFIRPLRQKREPTVHRGLPIRETSAGFRRRIARRLR